MGTNRTSRYFAIRTQGGALSWDGPALTGTQQALLERGEHTLDVELWRDSPEGPERTGVIRNACPGCLHSQRQDHGNPSSPCPCCARPAA